MSSIRPRFISLLAQSRGARSLNRPVRQFATWRFTDDSGHAQTEQKPEPVNRLITTKLEGRDAVPQAVYFLAFAVVGVPLCIRTMLTTPLPADLKTVVLLSVIGLISYHVPVIMPSRVVINPGFPLLMGALYCHGAAAANLVIVPSMLLHFFTRNHGLLNCLFNVGQFTLCTYGVGTVGQWLGWVPGVPAAPRDLLPVCLMIVTFDVVNVLFVSGSRSIENKEPWFKCLTRLMYTERRAILPLRAFLTVVAMLLASHMGDIAFVIVFVGVMSLRLQNVFQKELVEKTEEAETDPLTATHNMRYLNSWLETELGGANDGKGLCSFIFADIDGLKKVNDRYGHETGDYLLIHVAGIFLASVRSKDQVVRYGGDEFVIALPGIGRQQAVGVAMRILQASHSKPFLADGAEVDFGISIGVASWPEHGETAFDAIRMADRAMYVAKKNGGDRVHSAADL